MYRGRSWLFGLGLCLATAAPAVAQSLSAAALGGPDGGTERPLDIDIRTSLDFSRATMAGAKGGQIAIDPNSGTRSVSGEIVDLGGSAFAGNAIVTGTPGRAIRIEMPPSIRLTNADGGSVQIINLRTNLPPAPRLDLTGRLEFAFGGELLIKGDVAGKFRGRIPITAEYE